VVLVLVAFFDEPQLMITVAKASTKINDTRFIEKCFFVGKYLMESKKHSTELNAYVM
jgi:hypothetical protein